VNDKKNVAAGQVTTWSSWQDVTIQVLLDGVATNEAGRLQCIPCKHPSGWGHVPAGSADIAQA
jgi:hypothetical protein